MFGYYFPNLSSVQKVPVLKSQVYEVTSQKMRPDTCLEARKKVPFIYGPLNLRHILFSSLLHCPAKVFQEEARGAPAHPPHAAPRQGAGGAHQGRHRARGRCQALRPPPASPQGRGERRGRPRGARPHHLHGAVPGPLGRGHRGNLLCLFCGFWSCIIMLA